MPGGTVLTDYSNFIKEWYTDAIQKARARRNVFLDDAFTRFSSSNVRGLYAYIPVEFMFLGSVGSRPEDGSLPTPSPGNYNRAYVGMTYHYATLKLTKQLMLATEGDRAAFNPAVAQVTSTTMDSWLHHLNRMTLGDGRAYLAQVDGSPSVLTITLDNAFGIANDGNGDLFVSPNQRVQFFTGNTLRSSAGDGTGVCTIDTMTRGSGSTSATITLISTDVTTGIADGDYMFLEGNKVSGAAGTYESQGIMLLIDDGSVATTFQNLSTNAYPDWKSHVFYGTTPGTAEALTRTRMNKPWKAITQKGKGDVNLILCGVDTEETYIELCDSLSISVNPKKLDAAGMWEGPSFRNATIIADPVYPEGRFEFMDSSVVQIYENEPASWIPGTDGIFKQETGTNGVNKNNWIAEYMWFFNLVCTNRGKTGSLRDVATI